MYAQANLNRMPAECPLVFTEPKAAHRALRDKIFGASAAQQEARRRAVPVAPHIGTPVATATTTTTNVTATTVTAVTVSARLPVT